MIDDAKAAEASLDPIRSSLLAALGEYVISPSALGGVAPDPSRGVDRLSARWMLAVAARLVQDVGTLLLPATAARAPISTFTIDSEVNFATAEDRAAFAEELSRCVIRLARQFDSPGEERARPHRLVVALRPSVTVSATGASGGLADS